MNIQNVERNFFGQNLKIETGKLAKQADGSVTVQTGDTVLLATVVSSKSVKENQDFFPLTVDYREKVTAAGKFRGGYLKRETKATQKETLVARLTDRPIRPLFDDGFLYEVMIDVSVISVDKKYDPDVYSILAASAALSVSTIPFNGPVGGVRVGRVDGKYIINPSQEERLNSDMDFVVAGNKNGILMVEGHSHYVQEDDVLKALDQAYEAIKIQLDMQNELTSRLNLQKDERQLFPIDEQLKNELLGVHRQSLREILYIKEKQQRSIAVDAKFKEILAAQIEKNPETNESKLKAVFKDVQKTVLRQTILEEGLRADGRGVRDIRPIWIETGLLPKTHGSSVFTRGETQALAVATLGGGKDIQHAEDFGEDVEEWFYLHYNFPGYSVGECKPNRGPGRREIGHGVLAERALQASLPTRTEFPYSIRLTSDVLESNGSSSMATVCAGSLALMDAGVPIKGHVSGIALGLIKEENKVAILSDILGLEDALGDMDFKVAGSKEGITALQMDIKIEGLTKEIMYDALIQAKEGRLKILETLNEALPQPRALSRNAPRILQATIPTDKIGMLIGPGGKNIKELSQKYQVDIEISDDGRVSILGENSELSEACRVYISLMAAEAEPGKKYTGTVKTITNFGAFIEILPGKEGLLHISRIANKRINKVEDELSVGQTVEVLCLETDDKGRISLSRKELLENNAE